MRVGIVGAGNNADYHVRFSKAYAGAQLVGIADTDLQRAEEYVRNYGIARAYSSTATLLSEAKPDVVHVVTPPRTHFSVVSEALEAGCHVIVEKPLAMDLQEARALYQLAERRGVLLCPVHNHLFDPCMQRADSLIKSGQLGRVVNVESYYGLNTNIPAFRDYPQPNVLPWLYRLPGGVYQDFMPHPLYLLLEYTGTPQAMSVMRRSHGTLAQSLPDEIRILVDGEQAMGTVTVSFAARPHLHFVRVYGTEGMVEVDINTMTTTVHRLSSLPKAATKATYNLEDSFQKTVSTFANTVQFLTGKLKPYHGMMNLVHAFYDSIARRTPPPVSKERALAVVEAMDVLFDQLKYDPLKHENLVSVRTARPTRSTVLVTGGTGFLGKALVRRLIADGYRVRVLARKLSKAETLHELGAEVFWGDVADVESFGAAMAGCDVVIHLAAGTSGSDKDSQTATLQGTRNVLELCRQQRLKRLVYISSCSVYGVADYAKNAVVNESAGLEKFPERRGSYSASKLEAETFVARAMKSGEVPSVIVRPGTIYGPGGDLYTPIMGFSMGSVYVVIGTGGFVLPFVYVDNLVEAIVKAVEKDEAVGQIFNVVDPEKLTKRAYMNAAIRRINPKARVFYFPYSLLYAITWMQERVFGLMKRRPVLSCYRLTSSQKSVLYDSSAIMNRLGWKPVIPLAKAMDQLVSAEMSKRPSTVAGQKAGDSVAGNGPPRLPAESRSAH